MRHRNAIPARAAVALLLLTSAAAGPAAAQAARSAGASVPDACAEVGPGDRVSFRTLEPPGRWIGTLVRYDGEGLVIDRGGAQESFRAAAIAEARVECRLRGSGPARTGTGFGRGALIGGLAFAAAGTFLLWEEAGGRVTLVAPITFLLGTIPGGIIGGLAGAGSGEERRWVDWELAPGSMAPSPPRSSSSPAAHSRLRIQVGPSPYAPGAWSIGVRLPLSR